MTTDSPKTTATPTLSLSNLTKLYPTPSEPLLVLDNISLSLSPPDTLAILGPSGSGKSTLLNILGTLDHPTSGQVLLSNQDPFSLPPAELARFRSRHIGFVFQEHHLLPQCTALENILLAKLALSRVEPADFDRAHDLLARVGLSHRATHLPSELSGGERQRVAIARALFNKPLLLLADEPTGNLDSKTAQSIADLLLSLSQTHQTLLITATHSPSLAQMLTRRLRLEDHRLVDA